MKHFIVITALLGAAVFFSCSKTKNNKKPEVKNTDSVTNEIYLEAYGAFDTTNDLKGLGFYKSREIGGLRRNYADDKMLLWASKYSDGAYKIRYIGQNKLIDPVKVYFDGGAIGGETVTFYLNDSLKGQPIFEVYNESSKEVYKRIIASPDSCSITVYLGWVTQAFKVDTARVRNNYHYYLGKIDALNYEISED